MLPVFWVRKCQIWGVFDERSDNWKKKVKTKSEVRREKRNSMFLKWGKKLMRKKNQLKTKGGESKEREKKKDLEYKWKTAAYLLK